MPSVQESFDRIVVLKVFATSVGTDGKGGLSLTQVDQTGTGFPSRQADGSPGYRIRFKVDKVQEVTPNPTSLFIYNLAQDSRAKFQKNYVVELEAGYGEKGERIFRGNVSRVRTYKEGPDFVTHIEAADGLFAVQNSRIDQSIRTSTTVQSVMNTLISALKTSGITQGDVNIPRDDTYQNGIVLSGNAMDLIRRVAEKVDCQATILNGKVTILPIDGSNGKPAFLISPTTGLIGIPEQRDVGISLKTLLNPKLDPFQEFIIQSKFINGIYRALKVVHEGDTYGTDFYTSVEAA